MASHFHLWCWYKCDKGKFDIPVLVFMGGHKCTEYIYEFIFIKFLYCNGEIWCVDSFDLGSTHWDRQAGNLHSRVNKCRWHKQKYISSIVLGPLRGGNINEQLMVEEYLLTITHSSYLVYLGIFKRFGW